ncbi:MAG: bifunctional oligoribonuclease/PAP phosphatase NrnA [Sedimentisphaerales bacterium]|nr:bifunctional oligoribonuclease/PAP phosphatase NrnA [Sedimentisphaerales bacterium]
MDFQKAVELINKSHGILITTHTKPDGDACGSVAALHDALTALGKKVKLLFLSPLPNWYQFLFAEKVAVIGQNIQLKELIEGRFGKFDLIIIIDTNSYSQLPKFEEYLKQTDKSILVIDHHVTSDNLGTVELVEPKAAATALIVHDFFKYAKWPETKQIAQALFLAVATDTGWFHFSNTDDKVFRSCAELIEAGAEPTELYRDLYQNFSPQRFKLMAVMFSTLELHFDGRYAAQYLRQQDFEQTGASYEDTEDFINECQRIDTVEVAALFVELKDGRIRCSLRSKGSVDVCKIAQKFGGGGHKTAAGTYLPSPLENAMRLICEEISKRLA